MFTRYMNETGDEFPNEIGPAPWTFSIWGIIYLWQGVWMIYSLISICKKTENGYFYITPDIWHPAIFISFSIANIASVVWAFAFDRWYMVVALFALAAMPASLYVAIGVSARKLTDNQAFMAKTGLKTHVWLIRLLLHNGMGVYCTWTTIATLLNLTTVLGYWANLGGEIASTVSFTILGLELLFWFSMDIFFLDRWVRYLFVPYFVVVWALIGSIADHWNPTKRNSIITAVLLGLGVIFLIVKMTVMIWRHNKKPFLKAQPEKEKVQSLPL